MKFPKSFFSQEDRDGFTVATMMKRAWAAELEVLETIKSVCEKHDIKWYAFYGTLLGAVRHKGFIPWDDDIDICMLREDYMRFMDVAPHSLQDGFVISGIFGEDSRLWEANKEPQGRVIADELSFSLPEYMNYFHAFPYMRIGVDIFPLDNLPSDSHKQVALVSKINDLQRIVKNWNDLKLQGQLDARLQQYEEELGTIFEKEDEVMARHELLCAVDQYARSVPSNESDSVADIMYLYPPAADADFMGFRGIKKEWFGDGKELPYEHITMRVPDDSDSVLRATFGDNYMTPIKFTAEHEYPFYKNQEKAFKRMLKEAGNEHSVDEFCSNWHKMIGGE